VRKKIEAKVLPALGLAQRGAAEPEPADGPAAATTAVTTPARPGAPAARPQPALVTGGEEALGRAGLRPFAAWLVMGRVRR